MNNLTGLAKSSPVFICIYKINIIMKTFKQFLLEKQKYSQYDKQVTFITLSSEIKKLSGNVSDEIKDLNKNCLNQLFHHYSIVDTQDQFIQIPTDLPICYYGGHNKKARNFIEDNNLKKSNMYNNPGEMEKSGDKIVFTKLFSDKKWIPKSVFDKNKVKDNLEFPIIAKVADGHSGIGIKKFDSFDELEKSTKTFDLFSEFIDFEREFRIMVFKDKFFMINERIPTKSNKSTVKNKKTNDRISFIYVYTDLDKIPVEFKDKINTIIKEIRTKIKLDIWSIDICKDKNGDLFAFEINSATGLGSAKMVAVYKEIYEDFYQKKLPKSYLNNLYKNYVLPAHQFYYKNFKEEIRECPWRIDYEKLKP